MRKIMGIICFALALCAAQSIPVMASESSGSVDSSESTFEVYEDDTYIYYETGVYDKLTGEYFLYEEGSLDENGKFVLGSEDNVNSEDDTPSLSEKHLSVLDALGDLLDYVPSGDEQEISVDEVENEVFSDTPSESDYIESIASDVSAMSDIMLLSQYDTYYGSISSTYLEYMRGFLGKFPFDYHYVAFRSSQYDYTFVFGKDLEYNGSGSFSGSDVTSINWNTRNYGSYSVNSEGSFGLNAGSNMVYTDLGYDYPSLMDYGQYQTIQVKWILLIFVLSVWMISLYKGYRRRGDKDKKYAHVNSN